jgi:proline dehydrogenase
MPLWKSAMDGLARSRAIAGFMQGNRFARGLASRFVGGDAAPAAIRKCLELSGRGVTISLNYLGEYLESPAAIEENVAQILEAIRLMGQSALDVHASIYPTQIGYARSDELGCANGLRLGQAVSGQPASGRRRLLMLDMEDFPLVQKTLDLRARLAHSGCPTGITIQAYLHRTGEDLRSLVEDGAAAIRLVKGAFLENPERAWTHRADIDREYLKQAGYLLSAEAKARGTYPVFATHDAATIQAVAAIADRNHWRREEYEFEMLYGVGTPLQRRIVADGRRLRLYVPFGAEWWPYTMHRIGENPANARAVLSALWHSRR